jgi:hypothetical protein
MRLSPQTVPSGQLTDQPILAKQPASLADLQQTFYTVTEQACQIFLMSASVKCDQSIRLTHYTDSGSGERRRANRKYGKYWRR